MTTDDFTNVEWRRVVASDTAESIGSVRGFILDGGGRRSEAIHVDGHGKWAILLGWSAVDAFGADAVMARAGADASTIVNDHQKAAVKGVVTMFGTRVPTVDGREVGTVDDVDFVTDYGGIVRVVTDRGPIDADRLRALGSYALVVEEAMASTGR